MISSSDLLALVIFNFGHSVDFVSTIFSNKFTFMFDAIVFYTKCLFIFGFYFHIKVFRGEGFFVGFSMYFITLFDSCESSEKILSFLLKKNFFFQVRRRTSFFR